VLERRHGRIHRVLGIREALQVALGEVRSALGVPGPGPDTANCSATRRGCTPRLRYTI
jgi:hypothetical protein